MKLRIICWSAFLLIGCQAPNSKPEPPKTLEPTKIPSSAPLSRPSSAPISIPSTSPVPSPASASAPATTPASMQGSLAASLPVGEVYYYLDTKRSKDEKYSTIDHPDPVMKAKLDALVRNTMDGDCNAVLASTAILSFVCQHTNEMLEERAPGYHTSTIAKTYALQNGEFVAVSLADLVKDVRAFEEFAIAKEFWSRGDGVDIENFTLSQDEDEEDAYAIHFYAENSYGSNPEVVVGFSKVEKWLTLEAWPLSLLKKTISAPEDVTKPELLMGRLTSLPFDSTALPEAVLVEGKVLAGFHWEDSLGENFFVFSWVQSASKDKLKKTTYLYGNHYLKQGETFINVRKIVDKQEKCELENKAHFIEDDSLLTDLDLDGVGEVSFSYLLGCITTSGVVPYKWFIVENGNKYALRGTLTVNEDGTLYAGEKKADVLFQEAPSIFLRLGEARW